MFDFMEKFPTSLEWKELARAARAMAYRIGQTAEKHIGTSAHPKHLAEKERFERLAQRCEEMARLLIGIL